MTDLITLARQVGPWAAIVLLVMWRVGVFVTKIANKVIDRHLAGFDALGKRIEISDAQRGAEVLQIRERLHLMAAKIQEHSEADAEVVAEVKQMNGRLDGLVEAFEAFTPVAAHMPARRRARSPTPADQEDTPIDPGGPVGIARRTQTPARGAGQYKIHRHDNDDSEG